MEKRVYFKYVGMDLTIDVELDKNGEVGKVIRVRAWDDNNDKYVKIPCDLDAFKNEMKEHLKKALAE